MLGTTGVFFKQINHDIAFNYETDHFKITSRALLSSSVFAVELL